MPHYIVNTDLGKKPKTIPELIDIALSGESGPVPIFDRHADQMFLSMAGEFGSQEIDSSASILIATVVTGMYSCAAVIMIARDLEVSNVASVAHINCGTIKEEDLMKMLAKVNETATSELTLEDVYVLYGVTKEWGPGYESEVEKIVEFGVPVEQVVWLDQLYFELLGIDSNGYVGAPGDID